MFLLALLLLDSLSKYGEKLEAVVGVVAIGVLLLVMNWFFHRVYWTEWIKGHRDRGKALTGAALGAGAGAATVAGLYTLGFTSVFREGFETVLFLQALQLSSGTGVVLAGVSLGLVADRGRRRRHLRARAQAPLQEDADRDRGADRARPRRPGRQHGADDAGRRLAADPPDRHRIPALDGHLARRSTRRSRPSVAQLLAFCFVIGSYFAAEWMRKRDLRQAIAAHEEEQRRGAAAMASGTATTATRPAAQ